MDNDYEGANSSTDSQQENIPSPADSGTKINTPEDTNIPYGGYTGTQENRYRPDYMSDRTADHVPYGNQPQNQMYGAYTPYSGREYAAQDTPPYPPYRQWNGNMPGGETDSINAADGNEQKEKKKEKKKTGASKGFVVAAIAIGLVLSLAINAAVILFAGDTLSEFLGLGNIVSGGSNVVVKYAEKKEKTVVTEKGDVAYVASVAADSVVEITTETVTTSAFYGQYVTQGAGSGVIISSDEDGSYIITCAHVIDGASKVTITVRSGEKYDAVLMKSDSVTDVGIVKINVSGLTCATIGDYSDLVVGERVVAIGNPLGSLGGSVASGYVSALERNIIIDNTTYHLLQTDTAINPGNSGGGLFNASGDLIGIVNAKSSGSSVEGLGFAIPIDSAMKIAEQLIKSGYVEGRAKLGLTLYDVTNTQQAYNLWLNHNINASDYGVYVVESETDKFQPGDRLIALDNIAVSDIADIKSRLLDYSAGQTVTVTISRTNNKGRAHIMNIETVLLEASE